MRTMLVLFLMCFGLGCGHMQTHRTLVLDLPGGPQFVLNVPAHWKRTVCRVDGDRHHLAYRDRATGDTVTMDAVVHEGPTTVESGDDYTFQRRTVPLSAGPLTFQIPRDWVPLGEIVTDRRNCAAYRDPQTGYTATFDVTASARGSTAILVRGRDAAPGDTLATLCR